MGTKAKKTQKKKLTLTGTLTLVPEVADHLAARAPAGHSGV